MQNTDIEKLPTVDRIGITLGIIFWLVFVLGIALYIVLTKSKLCNDIGIVVYSRHLTWWECVSL